MTLAHGLLEGQFFFRFLAIVAWPHWVPFRAGGSGRCLPSSLKRHYDITFKKILDFGLNFTNLMSSMQPLE